MSSTTFQLTNGTEVRVDVADLPYIQGRAWHLAANCRVAYTEGAGSRKDKRTVYLARVLLGMLPDDSRVVDHINHDPLDNRRENLRICTQMQNTYNKRISKANTSGFMGVSKIGGKWRARVGKNGMHYVPGMFDTPEEAAAARDLKAIELYGEYASLNFPKAN